MASGGGYYPEHYISIGGVFVQVPYADSNIPYSLRVRNIAVCIAIQKMAGTISSEEVRLSLARTAAQALKEEVHALAEEVDASSETAFGSDVELTHWQKRPESSE